MTPSPRRRTAAALALVGAAVLGCGAPRGAEVAPGRRAAARAPAPTDPKPADYPTWHTLEPGEHLGYNQRASLRQRGKDVYGRYCVGCHGADGDGKGPAAERLLTQPRDFTRGIYKFRSTDSSSLPLEEDLHRTITRGLGGGASMPAFPLLAERDKLAVIEHVKAFYPRWDERAAERVVVPLPLAPPDLASPERVARGQVVYVAMQCGACHGTYGEGVAAEQSEFVDAWGNRQRAFDFTRGRLKGGDAPEDIYRTFHTGLRSIMPAYAADTLVGVTVEGFRAQGHKLGAAALERLTPYLEQFPATPTELAGRGEAARAELGERNSWDLVAYVRSLRVKTTTAKAVLGP